MSRLLASSRELDRQQRVPRTPSRRAGTSLSPPRLRKCLRRSSQLESEVQEAVHVQAEEVAVVQEAVHAVQAEEVEEVQAVEAERAEEVQEAQAVQAEAANPLCRQADDCIGSYYEPLVRHMQRSSNPSKPRPGDIYCVSCWRSIAAV